VKQFLALTLASATLASTLVAAERNAEAASDRANVRRTAVRARRAGRLAPKAKEFLDHDDWIGFRVFVRKNFSRIAHPEEWLDLRALIYKYADNVGYDLLYAWDKRPPGLYVTSGTNIDINGSRFQADNLMLKNQFSAAFDIYQRIAVQLKRYRLAAKDATTRRYIDVLYPYILQSMARALYGQGRYDDAFIVERWIPQTFPKFKEVQFEKMWAAFRGGRVDHALGAIASQNSDYFSRYLSPEAYLVETYLYKRLCREQDFQQVLEQMREFRKALLQGRYTIEDWTNSDVETRILWKLVNSKTDYESEYVSNDERDRERERVKEILERAFAQQRARSVDDLEKALAYVQLAVRAGTGGVLKPIESLPSRQTLFKLNLEIWPADTAEEWVDEIGNHRFIGESLCKNNS
jgi:hypothetical protein